MFDEQGLRHSIIYSIRCAQFILFHLCSFNSKQELSLNKNSWSWFNSFLRNAAELKQINSRKSKMFFIRPTDSSSNVGAIKSSDIIAFKLSRISQIKVM